MRAALYVRVSTETQVEDGFSISAQNRMLTEYCQKNDIIIHDIYLDEGISGQKEERPSFQRMIKDAYNKCFNIILVHKFDRFARKVELSQRIKRQLKDGNVNVISITEPIEDSPIGFFQEGIMELLSEYYVRNLSIEVKKGMVEAAKQGSLNGHIPYGYNDDKSINLDKANIVRQIFDWYVYGGLGIAKISKTLNENRIPSPAGKQWRYSKVRQVLTTIKYIGKINFSGEIYQGNHEAIISEEDFSLAKHYFATKTNPNISRTNLNYNKFFLLGFLKCGACGKTVRIQKDRGKYYYRCSSSLRYDTPNRCTHTKCYHQQELETEIINAIKNPVQRVLIAQKAKVINMAHDFNENRKNKIKEELERSRQSFLKGIFTEKEYLTDKKVLTEELAEIKNQPKQQNAELADEYIKDAYEAFDKAKTIHGKRTELKKVIDNITIYPNNTIEINAVVLTHK